MSGLETLVGAECCARRFQLPDWERQVNLAIRLDLLVAEQDMVRSALDRRDDYTEQVNALLNDSAQVANDLTNFALLYPDFLVRELRRRAAAEQSTPIKGMAACRDQNPLKILRRVEFVLRELEELAVSEDSDDYDPYDDAFSHFANGATTSSTFVEQMAREGARIPEKLADAERIVAAARTFFSEDNIDRLPNLTTTLTQRQEVQRITMAIRGTALTRSSTRTNGAT